MWILDKDFDRDWVNFSRPDDGKVVIYRNAYNIRERRWSSSAWTGRDFPMNERVALANMAHRTFGG